MKKISLLLGACFAGLFSTVAQQPFICTDPGTVLEYACYNDKGKLTGYTSTTIETCEKDADGCLEVQSRERILDRNRNPIVKKNVPKEAVSRVVVRSNEMVMPIGDLLASMLPDQSLSVVMTEGSEYVYPLSLSAGMQLPDVVSVYNIRNNGEPMNMNFRFSVVDRNVLAQERITVPAGTFEAYKIAETMSIKFSIINQTSRNVIWFVPGIGEVRTEQRSKNGKLETYTELVSILRPIDQ